METTTTPSRAGVRTLDRVVIRFAGDSGDGMQLAGTQFTSTTALVGNDLATFPDYPAEIRAPAGTLPGVSGFQIHFSSEDIFTPGDAPDVLVAMNPSALKVNLRDLKPAATIVVNADSFRDTDLAKAGYQTNPLEDGSLSGFQVIPVEMTRLTRAALKETGLPQRIVDRCKNFFALGLMYSLYSRPIEPTLRWIQNRFARNPDIARANELALKAGYAFGEASELFPSHYVVPPARLEPGTYRNISGNSALALGFVAAAQKAGRRLVLGAYPITPASDVLHELAQYKNYGIVTFQAEDEIGAIGAALGASFAGSIGVTTTSGPGMALKTEFLNLAVMAELPLVVVDIQRAGPSTGMPTKTEQADLFLALFGRPSDSPLIVLAARSPADCFETAYEAVRLAARFMTPVVLLSDLSVGAGSEPWRLPKVEDLPDIPVPLRTDPEGFLPYARDPETLARPWAVPGTPGLEHRIGGLEKSDGTGHVSYDPANHEKMTRLRAEKVARAAEEIPLLEVFGDPDARLLLLGWGSTYGAIAGAVRRARSSGKKVAHVHLRHLHPFPKNLGEILARFERVLVPENNLGQLAFVLQGRYAKPVLSFTKVQGRPFREQEILDRILELV
jgi:2-oxoglutarate ferredoxin oxidoreductase subunit alpha